MSKDNGPWTTRNEDDVGGVANNDSLVRHNRDTSITSNTVTSGDTNKTSESLTDKEVNKPAPDDSGSVANKSISLQSLPQSESSSGGKRVKTTNFITTQDVRKNSRASESESTASGFSICIGGKTYTYKEPTDPKSSFKPSKKAQKPVALTRESSGFPTEAYGQRPTISSAHGINYLSKEKPFLGLETIRALNSAYPFGRVQSSSYPFTLPASSYRGRRISEMKSSTLAGDLCQIFSVFFAILVRVVLAIFSILTVMVVVDKRNDQRFWALTSILSLLFVEAAYTVVKRRGQEGKWVSPCFICYLLATLPSIWLLELQKLGLFESKYAEARNQTDQNLGVAGLNTTIKLSTEDLISVVENCLVFLLILCRWLLPRGEISRDQLSQLLFVFIGMGSDVMELFDLFELEEVKLRRNFTYIILAVWSFSLFQFTLVLTMSANPKKARVALDTNTQLSDTPTADRAHGVALTNISGYSGQVPVRKRRTFKEFLVYSEVWSLIVTIFMQDGPYLAVRLYVMVELKVISSTIVFFVCKNAIVICLLLYRLLVVGLRLSEDEDDDSDDGMDFFFKGPYVNMNGNREGQDHWAKLKARAIPTVSARSALTDLTTLTPASTNARPATHKSTSFTDYPDSNKYGIPSKSVHAHSPNNGTLLTSDSAPSIADEGLLSDDPASVTVDDNPIIGTPIFSDNDRDYVAK